VRVTGADGEVTWDGAVPCLPQNPQFLSTCVVKAPRPNGDDLAFEGVFTPTTVKDPESGQIGSLHPAPGPARADAGRLPRRPRARQRHAAVGLPDRGPLAAGAGRHGEPMLLEPGGTWELDGGGTLEWVDTSEWVTVQVTQDPGKHVALLASAGMVLGLMLSLFVKRRRVWVRVTARADGHRGRGGGRPGPRTVVETGGLGRTDAEAFRAEFEALGERCGRTRRPPSSTQRPPQSTTRHPPGAGSHMTDEALAGLSDSLLFVTVLLYALAMLGFAGEQAARASARTVHPRQTAQAARTAAAERTRMMVGAGGPPVAERPAGDAVAAQPGRPGGRAARHRRVLAHDGSVVTRGLAVDRVPWGNMYEFSSAAALSAVVIFGVLVLRGRVERALGAFVMLPVVLSLGLAGTVLYTPAGPLVPALDSYWIKIHVAAAVVCTGAFLFSGVLAGLYLLRLRHDERTADGGTVGFPLSLGPRCRRRPRWTARPTPSSRSRSRSGPSRSSPAPSGPRPPGAGTGAGTPRRPGRSSPGCSTPATCTRGRPRAGRAARRRGSPSRRRSR
jgi:hypothetical protein